MTGFKFRSSGMGSDHAVHCATTSAFCIQIFCNDVATGAKVDLLDVGSPSKCLFQKMTLPFPLLSVS